MHLVQRFLQCSDTVVEELLFLVFQPTICRAIRTRIVNMVNDGVVQSWNFGWQPVLELTCDQMRCPGSKWLLIFPKLKEFMKRHKISWRWGRYLHGIWLAGRPRTNNSSTTGSSVFQLEVSMLKSDKIWCAYLVVNCVGLQTFWTPLVHFDASIIFGVTQCCSVLTQVTQLYQ